MTEAPRADSAQAEAFIDAAYQRLLEGGVDAVKVASVSEAISLTRTAFYWHFKDREALLDALLARWEAKNTGNLIARTEAFAASDILGAGLPEELAKEGFDPASVSPLRLA